MLRPTVIQCACLLGDGTVCGVDVPVKEKGNIPRYCVPHRDQGLRDKLRRQAQKAHARDEPDRDNDVPVAQEQESGEAGEAPRICRARSCSIPLPGAWLNDFCPGHWRLLSVETRGELVNSGSDPDLYDKAVLRALQEITRFEGLDTAVYRS